MVSQYGKELLWLELVLLSLFVFSQLSSVLASAILWLVFTFFWLLLTYALFVKSKNKRAILLIHFYSHSSWRQRLSGGVLMFGMSLLKALPLALMLLVSLLQKNNLTQWLILLFIPVFLVSFNQLTAFKQHIKAEASFYLQQKANLQFAMLLAVMLLTVVAVYFQPIPKLTGLDVAQAVDYYRQGIAVKDEILYLLLSLYAVLDGVNLLLLQQLAQADEAIFYQLAAIMFIGFRVAIYSLPIIVFIHSVSLFLLQENKQALKQLRLTYE